MFGSSSSDKSFSVNPVGIKFIHFDGIIYYMGRFQGLFLCLFGMCTYINRLNRSVLYIKLVKSEADYRLFWWTYRTCYITRQVHVPIFTTTKIRCWKSRSRNNFEKQKTFHRVRFLTLFYTFISITFKPCFNLKMFRMAMKTVVTLSSVPKLTIPFTYIAWQKGYIHPFPLTVGICPLSISFSCW